MISWKLQHRLVVVDVDRRFIKKDTEKGTDYKNDVEVG